MVEERFSGVHHCNNATRSSYFGPCSIQMYNRYGDTSMTEIRLGYQM